MGADEMNSIRAENYPEQVDELLKQTLATEVPASARIRAQLLARVPVPAGEILTLSEVAQFLRLSEDDLMDIASELPAFELAGKVLVRKAKLLEWIAQREQQFAWSASRSLTLRLRRQGITKGVA
jgi:hypothetical protein